MSSSESDPDFVNNAPYTYERKKARRKVPNRSDGRTGRRTKELLGIDKGVRVKGRNAKLTGALAQYFEGELHVSHSESSEDDNVEEDVDDEEEHTPIAGSSKETLPERRVSDSATESSSMDEARQKRAPVVESSSTASTPISRHLPEKSNDAGDSATEDSGTELVGGSIRAPEGKQVAIKETAINDLSTTEPSDNDDDGSGFIPYLKPRPCFPLGCGQHRLGPLVLSEATNDTPSKAVPGSINTFLRDYQREGVRFFFDKWKNQSGGVLGDDMGLGKTIQVISFLSAIMDKRGDERDRERRRKHVSKLQDLPAWRERRELPAADSKWPTCLIVAPSSVVGNWEREFDTWGYFEVGVFHGAPADRNRTLKDFKMGRLDVLLSSFETARTNIDQLTSVPISCIIIDEAHRLKNSSSNTTKAFCQFESPVRFGLTGTAIQNTFKELWTLLDWCCPGALGSEREWKKCITVPLTAGQSRGATVEEQAHGKQVARILVEKILPKFFLRRTKDIIKHQLPAKIDEVVFCPLAPKQLQVYQRILDMPDVQNIKKKDELCDCESGKKRGSCCHRYDQKAVFQYMAVLIKISNHLALILPSPQDTEEQTKRNRALAAIGFEGEGVPKYGQAIFLPEYCGKWEVLNKLLTTWRVDSTNKVLIFTKSVKLLDMLDYHLTSHGYNLCRLEGSTKQSERMPLIDKFNQDPDVFVFLISTLAGGTGLNLTSANKVVIFDPNWNPAHDLQAMDRAYRFGQTRDVHVYRFLGAGSIEELIYARQVYKQQLMMIGYEASNQTRYFQGVQGDAANKGELFGLANIFSLQDERLVTQMAIEKAHAAEFDWTLANVAGKSRDRGGKKSYLVDEGNAVGNQSIVKDEDLRGLDALMFDDDAPSETQLKGADEEDEIRQVLSGSAVRYKHRNANILRPSKIDDLIAPGKQKGKRRRTQEKLKASSEDKPAGKRRKAASPDLAWPPRRKHHTAPLSPLAQLGQRRQALIDCGIFKTPDDYKTFIDEKFPNMSALELREWLAMVDRQIAVGGKRTE